MRYFFGPWQHETAHNPSGAPAVPKTDRNSALGNIVRHHSKKCYNIFFVALINIRLRYFTNIDEIISIRFKPLSLLDIVFHVTFR